MNEVDAGRDRAMSASFRHDDDEPLTPISPPAGGEEEGLLVMAVCTMPNED